MPNVPFRVRTFGATAALAFVATAALAAGACQPPPGTAAPVRATPGATPGPTLVAPPATPGPAIASPIAPAVEFSPHPERTLVLP